MKLRTALLLARLPLGLAALAFTIPGADAQTLTVFSGPVPSAVGVVQGRDGNFYVTTDEYAPGPCHCGAVFRITPSGSLTNLYAFRGRDDGSKDGSDPTAPLVQGSDGSFYGTTYKGGTNTVSSSGYGTVFRITPSGSLTNLYSFNGPDGSHPDAGLVEGSDGNFYGTTQTGGASLNPTNGNQGAGTVFKISSAGTLTTLYSFCEQPDCLDGRYPRGTLVQGDDGDFYGTTRLGGSTNINSIGGHGYGTVFKISPSGSLATLYSFSGADGGYPYGGLVQGNDGNLYGTTYRGGTKDLGTVFRISPSGTLTTLYFFNGLDGAYPWAALVQGSDGNFYGTTDYGGAEYGNLNAGYGWGTVFKISPSGNLTNLYSFTDGNDGGGPTAPLVQGIDGYFYGATWIGGAFFQLFVPLNPPANQISAIQFFSIFDNIGVATLIPSVAGESYQLQYTDSMSPTNWINTGSSVTSIGGPLILTDIPGLLPPQRFYRAVITP